MRNRVDGSLSTKGRIVAKLGMVLAKPEHGDFRMTMRTTVIATICAAVLVGLASPAYAQWRPNRIEELERQLDDQAADIEALRMRQLELENAYWTAIREQQKAEERRQFPLFGDPDPLRGLGQGMDR